MPKIDSKYQNNLRVRTSDKMLMLINNARRSIEARQEFGVIPNQSEFIRGVIYYWIRENVPEILEIFRETPEILEHKNLKNNQSKKIKRSLEYNQEHIEKRQKEKERERFLAWAKSTED
tara:strand:+ start:502 stop:858 length:357 start_codon:yes stop_codon:yes gene_type:complete